MLTININLKYWMCCPKFIGAIIGSLQCLHYAEYTHGGSRDTRGWANLACAQIGVMKGSMKYLHQ